MGFKECDLVPYMYDFHSRVIVSLDDDADKIADYLEKNPKSKQEDIIEITYESKIDTIRMHRTDIINYYNKL